MKKAMTIPTKMKSLIKFSIIMSEIVAAGLIKPRLKCVKK
jgi:hypothetical protein